MKVRFTHIVKSPFELVFPIIDEMEILVDDKWACEGDVLFRKG
jgi:hypothetical protein